MRVLYMFFFAFNVGHVPFIMNFIQYSLNELFLKLSFYGILLQSAKWLKISSVYIIFNLYSGNPETKTAMICTCKWIKGAKITIHQYPACNMFSPFSILLLCSRISLPMVPTTFNMNRERLI